MPSGIVTKGSKRAGEERRSTPAEKKKEKEKKKKKKKKKKLEDNYESAKKFKKEKTPVEQATATAAETKKAISNVGAQIPNLLVSISSGPAGSWAKLVTLNAANMSSQYIYKSNLRNRRNSKTTPG